MDRITEKELRNQKFFKNEKKIVITLLSVKEFLSIGHFIQLAKISRSTFYRHHKNLHEVVPDYEKYILHKCKKTMERLMSSPDSELKTLFLRIIIFMSANRLEMELILKKGQKDFFERIVFALKPKIIFSEKVSDGEAFNIYAKEVAGIIEGWGRAGFSKKTISSTIDKILFLTDEAHSHLDPLVYFNREH